MIVSRRQFLAATIATIAVGQVPPKRVLRIVCVGGHPDDPESGCGGTLARYATLGHTVTVIYLTRGEAGIPGKSHEEAATIRSAECTAACKILGAKPVFAGQIDGARLWTPKPRNRSAICFPPNIRMSSSPSGPSILISTIRPPARLLFRAWLSAGRSFDLYYYEVDLGAQTMGFHPTDYVDITAVRETKKAALFAHKSQNGEEIYRRHHEIMENFRGREAGTAAAEGFVHLARGNGISPLPGLAL